MQTSPPQRPPGILRAAVCLVLLAGGGLSLFSAEPARKPAAAPPLSPAKNLDITIPRAALGKEFLISASIIPQVESPTSHGLAGKIVRFELFHDGVDLYESTQGLVVTDELPARRLLTTFPIVELDADKVVIDFNKGMRRVFTDIWYSVGGFNASGLSRALELPQSRVFEVNRNGDQLVIRQSAQARDRQVDANREERYEIRYFISPYLGSDAKGKETSASEARFVRYFEVPAMLEPTTGRATSRIARFDIREPLTFYWSANTPDDYVQAVKDGILYWNRAFGKNVVKAEKAPTGVTAPDAKHNIVQWVPWDNAGAAYADILVDPRTGASQRGQAYMTSVFAIGGKSRARIILRNMRTLADDKSVKEKGDPKTAPNAGPGGRNELFPLSSVCSFDTQEFAAQIAAGLESLLADDQVTDAAVLRASQDYVRQVVSHEVGHVLGLRHNFAGSLATTLSHKELDEWFKGYLAKDDASGVKDKLVTSSVMEYTVFKSSVFVGQQIRTNQEALPYDRAAIQWGYFDSNAPKEKKLLLGTDQDAGAYGDVKTFDYGAEPVVSSYAEIAEQVRGLPNSLIESFIRAKAPRDPRDRRPVAEVSLSPGAAAGALAGQYTSLLAWFKASTRSLRVENGFEFVGELNRKEIIQAHWKVLNEQVDKLGGIDRVGFAYLPVDLKVELKDEPKDVVAPEKIDAKKLAERLGKLLDSPAYAKFVGLDDKSYTFTKEEKELILKRGKKYFEDFEKEMVKSICQILEKASRDIGVEATGMVGDDDVVAKLEKRIIDLAKLIVTAKDDDQRRRGKVDKSFVEVVDFKYDLETRLAAARMLGDAVGSFKGWAVDAKGDLNRQLKEEVDSALNAQNIRDFQDGTLSRPLRDWYLNQQTILALLPPKRPAAPPAAGGAPTAPR